MIYAEAAYFDGNHCAHVATRDEAKRLARIEANNRRTALHRERAARFGLTGGEAKAASDCAALPEGDNRTWPYGRAKLGPLIDAIRAGDA